MSSEREVQRHQRVLCRPGHALFVPSGERKITLRDSGSCEKIRSGIWMAHSPDYFTRDAKEFDYRSLPSTDIDLHVLGSADYRVNDMNSSILQGRLLRSPASALRTCIWADLSPVPAID